MIALATDLDRTLLWNGEQPYDGSLERLAAILREERITLIYVTGRSKGLVEEAIAQYGIPRPAYLIADVGTSIYRDEEGFAEDEEWVAHIERATRGWNADTFLEELPALEAVRPQEAEKQGRFKASFYVEDPGKADLLVREATRLVKAACPDATIVYSMDETSGTGLLDVLPKAATKLGALEHLRERLELEREEVVYSGDSGNDLLPLTSGYKAILVRNATEEVRSAVLALARQNGVLDSLHLARGYGALNGHYVSGIVEGLIRFGIAARRHAD